MPLIMAGVSFAGITPVVSPALAQAVVSEPTDLDMAGRHFEAAKGYYERGEYTEALPEFKKSYELTRLPNVQYNIGLCYEKLGEYEKAIVAFRLYLDRKPKASDKKEILDQIAGLKDKILARQEMETEKKKSTQKTQASNPKETDQPKAQSIETRIASVAKDTYLPPSKEESKLAALIKSMPKQTPYPWLLWTSVGLAVVGLTVGVIGHVTAKKREDEYNDRVDELVQDGKINGKPGNWEFASSKAESAHGTALNDLKEDVDTFGSIAIAGFVSSGAFLALGGFFYWLDKREPQVSIESKSGGGSVNLELRF